MASTMITLVAGLAASSIAAVLPERFLHSSLVERASSVGVELYVYNLGGQGCNIQHTGSSVTAVTVPLADNGTCVTFSSLKVPFLVKSAESIAYPAGYNCQVDFNNECGDTQGAYDEGLDHCQTANQYFGGVYVLCTKD
ncbi:hypothetical protein B0A54_08626 [Friedmanniomyces endolithicus]|uniref:Ubiquitin 3 binding protein But2 C-terminal domain-containing protein n=1 Tax=Friedmanniomyces endolithicus TaxID=329885 RepID=A0A4U0URV5_9PEZI|nr:hypothetical protein B0A54_08626 [Friedmanniomyces endolithicus]